ncbi:hypothetical protein K227x_32310 [Rubripirellula lacrimiformis]|uniref:Uncharacterized protein n=1 Tax=Rubripirellula lacrimiformis TaxID=1930273 RepID=A0A517NCG8_9BACT|nr:hypothetical protein [Rubripirellula lacrimiformis]QDT04834.1 hypothetical protein K227x_32310 [Rubripirellula lacrimiformis]
MRFECNSIFYPKPTDPTHYFRTNEMNVWCYTDGDEPVVAARLAVDYLDIARAVSDGQSILHVCDADSSAWMHVYEATIEPDIHFLGIREDFGFDDPIHGLVFIHGAVFHPDLLLWRRFIIDSVCRMYPEDTATVMWKHTTDLAPNELASIGFRKIAGSKLLFRPNMLENAYSALDDDRDPMDLVVADNAQDSVDDQWASLDDSGSSHFDEEE